MSVPTPPGARRSVSRVSMVSIGRMPIISEDENQQQQAAERPERPAQRRATSMPILPPSHLRRPSQLANKLLPPNGKGPGPAPLGPPIPKRSHLRPPSRGLQRPASFAGGTIYEGQFSRQHNIYIPPYPPPDYYSRPNKGTSIRTSNVSYRDSLRRVIVGRDLPDRAPPLKENYTNMEKIRESEWVARRGGWCRVILILAILIVLAIGLSVGLTLGLRDREDARASNTTADTSPSFPAGSFSFDTALTNISTACTADSATWRCPPYVTYAEATTPTSLSDVSDAAAAFFWTILPPDPFEGQHGYVVSSADNPFAPRFSNASMTLRDGNTPNERLEFEVAMNRTVTPAPSMQGFSAGVTCVFPTTFHGVVWTDRVGGGDRNRTTVRQTPGQDAGATWPGEVEITQISTEGPRCTDANGAVVKVNAGNGECLCRYANYDLESGSGSRAERRRLSMR